MRCLGIMDMYLREGSRGGLTVVLDVSGRIQCSGRRFAKSGFEVLVLLNLRGRFVWLWLAYIYVLPYVHSGVTGDMEEIGFI